MLQFLIPLLAAGAGAGIGAATNKKHPGKGALKGALAGGALGLGGVGLTGLGMGGAAATPLAAFGGGTSSAGVGAGARAAQALAGGGASLSAPASGGMMSGLGAGAKDLMTMNPNGNILMQSGKQQLASGLMSSVMGGGQDQVTPVAEMGGMSAAPAMTSAANIQMSNPLSFSNVDPQYLAALKQKMQQGGGY